MVQETGILDGIREHFLVFRPMAIAAKENILGSEFVWLRDCGRLFV